jgi:exonuclease III
VVSNFLLNIKAQTDSNTIVDDFDTQLSPRDRSPWQKKNLNKETSDFNGIVEQMVLTDIYRTLHPVATEYIFFSAAHETFSKTGT